MPHYLIVTDWCPPGTFGAAERGLPTRFPEVSVESTRALSERCWHIRCEAPSEEHPRRWLASFGIGIRSLTPHTTDDVQPAAPRAKEIP